MTMRHRLTEGVKNGIVAEAGLIAYGRGEAYDYLLGERTCVQAHEAEKAASAILISAKKPTISVNGNVAALCPSETVELARLTGARLEVNLFYRSRQRLEKIRDVLHACGADKVYGVDVEEQTIPGLDSARGKSDEAIVKADVVLVMLEDGDRTEKLKQMGKKIIAVDLNPLSRTAQMADVTVVDNVVRAIPNMIAYAKEMKNMRADEIKKIKSSFDNAKNLNEMEKTIRGKV